MPECRFGLCDGSGKIRVGENTDSFCKCFQITLLRNKLCPEIRAVPGMLKESPLYRGHQTDQVVDKTTKNIFLRGNWHTLLPHLKYALSLRISRSTNLQVFYRIVRDERLLRIWLGHESYTQKAKSMRDDIATYNNIADFIGSDQDLVILRLNFLKHKNVAMPNVLQEAMMLRESFAKPMWIIEEPDRLGWQYYLREDVTRFIDRKFERIQIEDNETPELRVEEDDEPGFGNAARPSESTLFLEKSPPPPMPPADDFSGGIPETAEDLLESDGLRTKNPYAKFKKKGSKGNY
jgi:hypothetical protein